MMVFLCALLRKWTGDERGVAAVEAAFVFPLLAVLMLGTFDIGYGILASQKTVRASQVTADLITRESEVDDDAVNEAVWAGQLSLEPFGVSTYGVDIVSISFDDDADPVIEWRETRNMSENEDVLSSVLPLADAGEGVVVVTIQYTYEPVFAGFSMGSFSIGLIPMQEVAFARGRKSAVVDRI